MIGLETRRTQSMFYRRKVLLGLLQALGCSILQEKMQKYLFLVCERQQVPSYHFVPLISGCFSFQANADRRTLIKYGLIQDQDRWSLTKGHEYLSLLKPHDQAVVQEVVKQYGNMRDDQLFQRVDQEYPYYAANNKLKVSNNQEHLFTIGYEGQALEAYLKTLINHSVTVLCDVRRNPMSMKYGFNKRQLDGACNDLGIIYKHIPELGIASSKRKDLKTTNDYKSLFKDYEKTTLKNNNEALDDIVLLLQEHKHVALTCFEEHVDNCHRGCVTKALQNRPSFNHKISHL